MTQLVTSSSFGQAVAIRIEEAALAQAEQHDSRARELEAQNVSIWSELASICKFVDEKQEWRLLNFPSFGKWLADACPRSRSHIYAGMGLLKELQDDVSPQDLKQIPQATAAVLKKLPKKLRRDPETISQAKTLRPDKFIEHVQKVSPESHIERIVVKRLRLTFSEGKDYDLAVAAMCAMNALDSPEAALHGMLVDWLDSFAMHEEVNGVKVAGLTNREAYRKLVRKGAVETDED